MRKATGTYLVFFLLMSALRAFGQPGGINPADSVRAGLRALETERETLQAGRDSLNRRAAVLAAEAGRLKERLAGSAVSLDQYRLEEVLRRSQALADSLDKLDASLAGLDRRLGALRRTAGEAYSATLDSLSQTLAAAAGESDRRMILERIESLHLARAGLSRTVAPDSGQRSGEPVLGLAQLQALARVNNQDLPEEIREKADFLADVSSRWSRAMSEIQRGIHRLTDEKEVRQRLGEFAQEISLFDETGVSGRQPSRSAPEAAAGKVPDGLATRTVAGPAPEISDNTPAGAQALGFALYDPEADLRLLQNLEHLSRDDIESALGRLAAHRDSLQADLRVLKDMERQLRRKSAELDKRQEGSPPK